MIESGLKEIESTYVERKTVNKKEGIDVARIFVQAKYCKMKHDSGKDTPDFEVNSNSLQEKEDDLNLTTEATEKLTIEPKTESS